MDIKAIRKKLGLTQEEFAHKLGVSWGTVARWEAGKGKASKQVIQVRKKLIVSVCLALILGVSSLIACAAPEEAPPPEVVEEEYEIIWAQQQMDEPFEDALWTFAELVNAKGEGRIKLVPYLHGELGTYVDNIDNIQTGAIHMTALGAAHLVPFVPWASVAGSLPFAWTDWLADFRWHEEIWIPEMNKALEAKGTPIILGPCVGCQGALGIYSAIGPIHSPADCVGKTFRSWAPGVPTKWMEALGAKAIILPFPELFSAMETGMVDLMHNPPSYMIDIGFYEVAPDFTVTNHEITMSCGMRNRPWWNALPEDIKVIIDRSWFIATAELKWNLWRLHTYYIEGMQKPPYNATVYYPMLTNTTSLIKSCRKSRALPLNRFSNPLTLKWPLTFSTLPAAMKAAHRRASRPNSFGAIPLMGV